MKAPLLQHFNLVAIQIALSILKGGKNDEKKLTPSLVISLHFNSLKNNYSIFFNALFNVFILFSSFNLLKWKKSYNKDDSLEKTLSWERLRARGEGDNRG